jgi:AraC-like DNA-binding protein
MPEPFSFFPRVHGRHRPIAASLCHCTSIFLQVSFRRKAWAMDPTDPRSRRCSAKRLELAKQLLEQSDQPLAHIALTLKFSCQANFTRAFREATAQNACSVPAQRWLDRRTSSKK